MHIWTSNLASQNEIIRIQFLTNKRKIITDRQKRLVPTNYETPEFKGSKI